MGGRLIALGGVVVAVALSGCASSQGQGAGAVIRAADVTARVPGYRLTKRIGSADVRGVPTTHYRAVIDLSRYPKLVAGPQRAASARSVSVLESALGRHTLSTEVWIDRNDLVRRQQLGLIRRFA